MNMLILITFLNELQDPWKNRSYLVDNYKLWLNILQKKMAMHSLYKH